MSHFKHHVFFCTNQRVNGEASCGDHSPGGAQKHAKQRCKELGLNGVGKVRISSAGCLDRCEHGPVMVVYPEAVWYHFVDNADVEEIIDSHLLNGKPVERLRLP